MYTKLSIPERLKDLRVVDKHLNSWQNRPACLSRHWGNMRAMTTKTSAHLRLRHWQSFTECPLII